MTDNSNAAPELLPCPFCGNENLKSGGDDKWVGLWCLDCEAQGPNHYGRNEWNTRADLARAQIAAAYEAAAQEADEVAQSRLDVERETALVVADRIREEISDDASAALVALLKAERAKAYERAAVEISDYQAFTKYAQEPLTNEMCAAIRALAQEDE